MPNLSSRFSTERLARGFRKVIYFLKYGYWHTGERVNPDFPDTNFKNHFKVYEFLSQFVQGKRVLDVGCGTGYGSAYLSKYASSVTGIDISIPAVRLATRKNPEINYIVMDAHKLTFPDNHFDFIISTENFEHLSDQRQHLRELRRVLADGGICFIATPNPEQFLDLPSNPFHTKENTYAELCVLLEASFKDLFILENQLPHNLERPHGHLPEEDPLIIFGKTVDKTYLSNTHSFFSFCR
jgi:SAM-dependent methyltransferase